MLVIDTNVYHEFGSIVWHHKVSKQYLL